MLFLNADKNINYLYMKIINTKDLLIITTIGIILFCLFKRPVKEYLENKESCPESCTTNTQIANLQNDIKRIETNVNTNKTNLANFIKKYNDTVKKIENDISSS